MKAVRLAPVIIFVSVLLTGMGQAGPIKKSERDYQAENFRQWWDTDFQWQFSELPTSGNVPDFRIPYSGHDYPDRGGGTIKALRGYDRDRGPADGCISRGRSAAAKSDELSPPSRGGEGPRVLDPL